ncbi:MAG: polyphosphate--nucleotide phosphotransferase [Ignavibacteria bacterium RBG_16_34_14]|nr:MAG: polyphosphate--nucleotide phosphotransferase [Ignavibacteria bacterium RBG_16_34_14]
MLSDKFLVKPGKEIDLSKIPTSNSFDHKKEETKKLLKQNVKRMFELQNKLYAQNKYSVLIIFQAMDAAGKDSTIKNVMSGLNPQGTQVYSFKQPSAEEHDHDYLWRIHKAIPERGRIGIFNRSHYEDVLVVRAHYIIKNQNLPEKTLTKDIWQRRFRQIRDFEKQLYENGTVIIKFFLHVSKEEQKKRFLKRIDKESKNWKFSAADIDERKFWDDYQKCYEEAIAATSLKHSPWFIIPADQKWFMQLAVSQIITEQLEQLDISYPKLSKEELNKLEDCRKQLLDEK